jgi:hypothetical protein
MEHGRLESILDSSSIPGIDFSPITRPKLYTGSVVISCGRKVCSCCYEKKTCGRRNNGAHLKLRIQIEKLFARE